MALQNPNAESNESGQAEPSAENVVDEEAKPGMRRRAECEKDAQMNCEKTDLGGGDINTANCGMSAAV